MAALLAPAIQRCDHAVMRRQGTGSRQDLVGPWLGRLTVLCACDARALPCRRSHAHLCLVATLAAEGRVHMDNLERWLALGDQSRARYLVLCTHGRALLRPG